MSRASRALNQWQIPLPHRMLHTATIAAERPLIQAIWRRGNEPQLQLARPMQTLFFQQSPQHPRGLLVDLQPLSGKVCSGIVAGLIADNQDLSRGPHDHLVTFHQ